MAISFGSKVKIILNLLGDFNTLSALISLRHSGYLVDIGWFNAFLTKRSVGKDDKPLPWVTYPFIDFLTPRLKKEFSLFEFGSGFSTLFFAERVSSVITVEHDKAWYEKMKNSVPANVEVIHSEESVDGNYSHTAQKTGKRFNIIIVDAVDRVNCTLNSLQSLSDDGILILDDSDREEYDLIPKTLHKAGFKQIDFWGISPGYLNRKATTVYYREKNCLCI
jgi:hypothetical protein